MRSSASSFNFQCPLVSLRPSSSCLRLLPRLPAPLILPSLFPSITSFRRQFLRKMWPIQLAVLLFIVCRIFLSSLTLRNIFFTFHTIRPNDLHPSLAAHFKTSQVFLIYFPKSPRFSTNLQVYGKLNSEEASLFNDCLLPPITTHPLIIPSTAACHMQHNETSVVCWLPRFLLALVHSKLQPKLCRHINF